MDQLVNDPDAINRIRENAAQEAIQTKIVLQFRSAIAVDIQSIAQSSGQAFGCTFDVSDEELDPLDAAFLPCERSDPVVTGKLPALICYNPPYLIALYVISPQPDEVATSPNEIDGTAEDSSDSYEACIEIELLPYVGNESIVEAGYSVIGKLAAELITDNCVGVYFPTEDHTYLPSVELTEAMRNAILGKPIDL